MTCEQARAAIADNILADSQESPRDSAELQAHLERCAACRAYLHECQSIWSALGELTVPAPAPNARARFDDALRESSALLVNAAANTTGNAELAVAESAPRTGVSVAPARLTPWTRALLMAASLVLAALAGYGAASWRPAPTATRSSVYASADSQRHYLLLLYDDTTSSQQPSPSELSSIVAEYSAWARTLRAKGQLVLAEQLSSSERSWLGGAAVQSDAFTVGGFFLIRARDLAEAERIAASCPHVARGRIEVRGI